MATAPTPDQQRTFAERAPDGSIFMLNLLKFRDTAEYADGRDTDLTGAQAYALYGAEVGKLISQLGGRVVWGGAANTLVIGDGELQWDQVAIVEYPSIASFAGMTASAAYQEIHVHRDAGLEHQLLINCLSAEQAQAMVGTQA